MSLGTGAGRDQYLGALESGGVGDYQLVRGLCKLVRQGVEEAHIRSDVHVLKLLDRFGDGDSAAAGGSLYGREAIEFFDDDQRGRGRARVVECAAGCQVPMTTVGV